VIQTGESSGHNSIRGNNNHITGYAFNDNIVGSDNRLGYGPSDANMYVSVTGSNNTLTASPYMVTVNGSNNIIDYARDVNISGSNKVYNYS